MIDFLLKNRLMIFIYSIEKSFHSISFKESKFDDLIKLHSPDHLDMIKLSKRHLVRVYPGTKRQNSSNIDPMVYWTYGRTNSST